MISIRRILKSDPTLNTVPDAAAADAWSHSKYVTRDGTIGFAKDVEKSMSAKDYIYLDDVYIGLKKSVDHSTSIQLKEYNQDCLRLIETALTNIDWKKYI